MKCLNISFLAVMQSRRGAASHNMVDRPGMRTDAGTELDESVRWERKAVHSSADQAVARYATSSRPRLTWPSSGRRHIGEGTSGGL